MEQIEGENKIFSWREVRCNLTKLEPEMLNDNGLTVIKCCRLISESTRNSEAKPRIVLLDKDYVTYRFQSLLKFNNAILDVSQINTLILLIDSIKDSIIVDSIVS